MKVLYVQPYVTFSGVLFDTLPSQLAQKGYEVLIVSFFRNKCLDMHTVENLKVYPIDAISFSFLNVLAEFPFFLSIESVIKFFNPDVIHVNNLPFLTTYQAITAAKKMQISSVLQVHGVTAERGHFVNALQFFYLKLFGKKIFKDVSKVICLTQDDARNVQKYGCSINKLCVIPNGVDTNVFKPKPDCEQPGLIVWIGRFVPEKGLDYLIKAINILVGKGVSSFRLLLIGDGPSKIKIQSQIRMQGLNNYIKIIPPVSHNKVNDFLNRASIFVIPSLKEGMPYVLLEAMSCGKPVVGSDIAGINNVIVNFKNGLLVSPRDSLALSEAILKLLSDKQLRQKLGGAARASTVNFFDWQLIVEKIRSIYSSVQYSD